MINWHLWILVVHCHIFAWNSEKLTLMSGNELIHHIYVEELMNLVLGNHMEVFFNTYSNWISLIVSNPPSFDNQDGNCALAFNTLGNKVILSFWSDQILPFPLGVVQLCPNLSSKMFNPTAWSLGLSKFTMTWLHLIQHIHARILGLRSWNPQNPMLWTSQSTMTSSTFHWTLEKPVTTLLQDHSATNPPKSPRSFSYEPLKIPKISWKTNLFLHVILCMILKSTSFLRAFQIKWWWNSAHLIYLCLSITFTFFQFEFRFQVLKTFVLVPFLLVFWCSS